MLHNLLSRENKKSMRNEYFVRLAGITLYLGAAAVFVGAISLMPAYINISSITGDIEQSLADSENVDTVRAPLAELARTAMHVTVLRSRISIEPMTDLMTDVLGARPEDTRLTGITFDRAAHTFTLRGISKTRDGLIAYKRTLEALESVESVSSPISDLAKNIDLDFTLTVQLVEKPQSNS